MILRYRLAILCRVFCMRLNLRVLDERGTLGEESAYLPSNATRCDRTWDVDLTTVPRAHTCGARFAEATCQRYESVAPRGPFCGVVSM